MVHFSEKQLCIYRLSSQCGQFLNERVCFFNSKFFPLKVDRFKDKYSLLYRAHPQLTPGRVAQSVGHMTHKLGLATYFRFSFRFSRTVVSYWRKYVHEVLVNRLGGLGLPRKSVVRLTDRPDMTLDVYRGRKTTMQQQQQPSADPLTLLCNYLCEMGYFL